MGEGAGWDRRSATETRKGDGEREGGTRLSAKGAKPGEGEIGTRREQNRRDDLAGGSAGARARAQKGAEGWRPARPALVGGDYVQREQGPVGAAAEKGTLERGPAELAKSRKGPQRAERPDRAPVAVEPRRRIAPPDHRPAALRPARVGPAPWNRMPTLSSLHHA